MASKSIVCITREQYQTYVLLRAGFGRVKQAEILSITPQLVNGRFKSLERHGIISAGVPGKARRQVLLPEDAFTVEPELRTTVLRRKEAQRRAAVDAALAPVGAVSEPVGEPEPVAGPATISIAEPVAEYVEAEAGELVAV